MDVLLAHARDQEHLVVHGEAEHDADHEHRQQADDGRRLLDPEQAQTAPLEDEHDRAEGRRDAQQEAEVAVSGTSSDRNTSVSNRNASPTTTSR